MLDTAENVSRFVLAGQAVFTLKSEKTETHFTYSVSKADSDRPVWFVSVLTGPNNETDYRYAGILEGREPHNFRSTAKARVAETAASVVAFVWFWKRIQAGEFPAHVAMNHSGHCARCGRKLTTPESVEIGFGPECAGKAGIARQSRRKPAAEALPAWAS